MTARPDARRFATLRIRVLGFHRHEVILIRRVTLDDVPLGYLMGFKSSARRCGERLLFGFSNQLDPTLLRFLNRFQNLARCHAPDSYGASNRPWL